MITLNLFHHNCDQSPVQESGLPLLPLIPAAISSGHSGGIKLPYRRIFSPIFIPLLQNNSALVGQPFHRHTAQVPVLQMRDFIWLKCSWTTAELQKQAEPPQLGDPNPQGSCQGNKFRAGHTFSLVWKGSQTSVWQNTRQSDPFGPICTLGSLPHSICKAVGFLVSSSLRVFSKTQGKWHFPADP